MVEYWLKVLFVYLVVSCQFATAFYDHNEDKEKSRQSLKNNSNPQNIIDFLDKLYDAARDKNYDSQTRYFYQSVYAGRLHETGATQLQKWEPPDFTFGSHLVS